MHHPQQDVTALTRRHAVDDVAGQVDRAEAVDVVRVQDLVGADPAGLYGLQILGVGHRGQRVRGRWTPEDPLLLAVELLAGQQSAIEEIGEVLQLLGLARHFGVPFE